MRVQRIAQQFRQCYLEFAEGLCNCLTLKLLESKAESSCEKRFEAHLELMQELLFFPLA
jgi:hypothetical protein